VEEGSESTSTPATLESWTKRNEPFRRIISEDVTFSHNRLNPYIYQRKGMIMDKGSSRSVDRSWKFSSVERPKKPHEILSLVDWSDQSVRSFKLISRVKNKWLFINRSVRTYITSLPMDFETTSFHGNIKFAFTGDSREPFRQNWFGFRILWVIRQYTRRSLVIWTAKIGPLKQKATY
jgi:hypothetical protein